MAKLSVPHWKKLKNLSLYLFWVLTMHSVCLKPADLFKTTTRGGGYSWKPVFVSRSNERQSLLQFSIGWEKNKQQYGSGVSVGEPCRAKQRFWTGPLSFTAGRTSLTRLAARGSWGLLYRNNETRYQWSHPPLPFIHPKRLWVALATCALLCVCVFVSMSGGLRNHRVKIMCHQRGLGAHGLVKGLGSCSCRAWRFYSM